MIYQYPIGGGQFLEQILDHAAMLPGEQIVQVLALQLHRGIDLVIFFGFEDDSANALGIVEIDLFCDLTDFHIFEVFAVLHPELSELGCFRSLHPKSADDQASQIVSLATFIGSDPAIPFMKTLQSAFLNRFSAIERG